MLNIGGVANVTVIDGENLIACDTGPGNALVDDFVRVRTGQLLDTDGRAAQAGTVDEDAIARFLAHPFFSKPPPKSLDRNDFRDWVGATFADRSVEDGAGDTHRAHCGFSRIYRAAVAAAAENLDRRRWRRAQSDADAHARRTRLAPARVETAHAAGWSINSLEAQAFAYMAVRCLRGLADQLPGHDRRAAPAHRRRFGAAVTANLSSVLKYRL